MKTDLQLRLHGSEGILEKWFSKQLPTSHQPPELPPPPPPPHCHPCLGPRSRGQMASPKGQVLFGLVIPLPPPSSAKHLSDRNLPVILAQSLVNLSKVSIHHILHSLEDEGGQGAYQWVKGVLIIWRGGGLSTSTGPLVGTWWEKKRCSRAMFPFHINMADSCVLLHSVH